MAAGQNRDALDVFQLNYKRNGDAWPVHGLARGLAANGDKKTALEHAKALAQAPDEINRKFLEEMVSSLSTQ